MMILSQVRNYIPSYNWVVKGGGNIADCVARSDDLEAMSVGTVAAGRIKRGAYPADHPWDILECYFDLIVQGGKLAGVGAHSYSESHATKGSDEAERFNK